MRSRGAVVWDSVGLDRAFRLTWMWMAIGSLIAHGLAGQTSPELRIRPLPGAKADVAALLFAGTEGGSLWTAASALPSSSGDGLELSVEIDGRSWLGAHDELPAKLGLEIYVYLLADSKLIDSFAGRLTLDTSIHGDRLAAGGMRISLPFRFSPGSEGKSYDLRLLVRDRGSQSFSLRRLFMQVESTLAPKMPPRDGWMSVGLDDRTMAPFDPWPVWVIGRDESPMLDAELGQSWELVDENGVSLTDCRLQWREGRVRVEGDPDCAGSRRLQSISSRGKGWSQPILLLESEWSEQNPSWAQVRRMIENPEARRQVVLEDLEGRRSRRVTALTAAYEDVLKQLASGDVERAVDLLIALDGELFQAADRGAGRQGDAPATLDQAIGKLVRPLAKRNPESLLPVIWLHLALHDRYVEELQQDAFVLEATWSRIRTLVGIYADAAADEGQEMAGRLASSVLAELGMAVDGAGLPRSALRLLQQATEVDPSNAEVWRYLVFWYERRGQVDRAVGALEKLLELRPELHDARLRWAIGLRRLGRTDAALKALGDILERRVAPEVEVVALQEAARIHGEAGRFDQAVGLLDDGLGRFPANQRLRLQLAHYLERRPGRDPEDRRRAAALLDELPPENGPSPRYVYQKPPSLQDGSARTELRRHAIARLPVLSQAMSVVSRREARR